jgi:hypothetical protein
MNEAHGFYRLGTTQSRRQGAFLIAHFTTDLVAMEKNAVGAEMAQDVDARIARNLFRAIAPENNLSLQVEHARADLQTIKDIAVSLRIFKGWHAGDARTPLVCPSAENWLNFIGTDRGEMMRQTKSGFATAYAGWHFSGSRLARRCHLQTPPSSLFSLVSSSGGGLPGRLGLERDLRRSLFLDQASVISG